MPPKIISFCLALLAFVNTGLSQTSLGNPLGGLEKLKDFDTMRASSSDPDWKRGSQDARPIAPGATLTLGEFEGPGQIVHIWCTVKHEDPNYSSLLTLRMYWDGEKNPSVECPLGDFFGMGHGFDKAFTSLPIRVTSDGRGRNCYWPMSFKKSARITISNDSDKKCLAFFYYIDWQKHRSLPKDSAYFHAMYRQEFPCVMGQNYLLADIQGCGHYVGTVQSVYLSSLGWFGEGNDYFFIDGEKEPRLRGTGTEDYFCDGWGFREQSGPFYGTPLWEGFRTGDRCTAYRFHIPDPVVFKKSLRVEIQHRGAQTFPDGTFTISTERDDLMSSVAYWYQIEPHKPWPALPSGQERLETHDVVLIKGYEAVASAKHFDHPIEVKELKGGADGKELCFRPGDDKGWLETSFNLDKDQSFDVIVKMACSPSSGIYRVKLDGKQIAWINLYAAQTATTTRKLSTSQCKMGAHTLRFECMGRAPESSGYNLEFDALVARIPVYSRWPSVDVRTLQHSK